MKNQLATFTSFALAGLIMGCAQEPVTTTSDTLNSEPASSIDGSQFLLPAEPVAAQDVLQVREQAQDGDDIVIVGRIGGSANPWIENRAAFSIVDGSLEACSDIPGDTCPQPWDYCCESDLPAATALVKVVDADGKLVQADARGLLNVKELATVVVQGKAKRDEAGNLTVLASGIFVRN